MSVSRSSASDGTGRRSAYGSDDRGAPSRGQVEPVVALAAVLAVGIAVSLYATALSDVAPGTGADGSAETTLDRVHRNVSDGNVVDPAAIRGAPGVPPPGYDANVTLTAAGETWQAGSTPPASAESASRRVSVRLGPGNVRPGRLRVVIWS
ncbi:hypothetical protein BRC81_13900 [Halobacteriales archaeon QS_1_68_20]|nr:MAG: hypothetical protein BRC81_13900 [Halobacteriales archaeon QS_1_68_20]